MKSRLSKIVIFIFLVANLGMAEYIKKIMLFTIRMKYGRQMRKR
ncbi:hypothetical protein [Leptotrichia hongkongensis]|nr:hypothetical protein [Leptotrichia hongkongensis]